MPKRKRGSDDDIVKGKRGKKLKTKGTSVSGWGKLRINKPIIGAAPLPAGRLVTFKYVESLAVDPGVSGAVISHAWVANGMYDPDYTGTGHQPRGYDQWLPVFFNHYCVVKSTITYETWSSDTNVNNTYVMGINLVDDVTTLSGTAAKMMERPKQVYKLVTNSNSGRASGKVTKHFDAQSFFNRKDVIGSDQLRGSSAGNPQEVAIFRTWIAAADGATNLPIIRGLVTITFTARLLEPRIQGPS